MASEVKSDLIIGFLLANLPYPPNFRSLGHPHGLQKLVKREREETDNYYTCGTASLPQVKTDEEDQRAKNEGENEREREREREERERDLACDCATKTAYP